MVSIINVCVFAYIRSYTDTHTHTMNYWTCKEEEKSIETDTEMTDISWQRL